MQTLLFRSHAAKITVTNNSDKADIITIRLLHSNAKVTIRDIKRIYSVSGKL
ncbi:MAG: hypothetical protein NVV82_19875 [Sporocytophaga sp.]|nr:hypothetical protein [Sporocytophaga sp.]